MTTTHFNYDHLRRMVNDLGDVILDLLRADADQLIISNPPIAHLAEYSCMLEAAMASIDIWYEQVENIRKLVGKELLRAVEAAARLTNEEAG